MKIRIREFLLDDIDSIYQLEKESYSEELCLKYHNLLEILSHSDVVAYVIENEDGKVISSFYLKFEKFKNELYLISLTVSADYRKLGVGTYALDFIQKIANQLKVNKVSVQINSNQDLVYFFEKNGFDLVKKLKDFIIRGNSGIELELNCL